MMKKLLLLAMAAMIAAGVSAAPAQQTRKMAASKADKSMIVKSDMRVLEAEAQMATPEQRQARPRKVAPTTTYYKRPAGVFFGGRSSKSYWLGGAIYGFSTPFAPVTYQANQASAYNWLVQLTGQDEIGQYVRQWYSASGVQNLSVQYGWESDSVAILTTADGTSYNYFGRSSGAQTAALIAASPDVQEWWGGDEEVGDFMLSPKSFMGDRDDLTSPYSSASYTGAKPDTINGVQTSGKWFGHNLSGWNAMALYLEKPENPYALRRVFIQYHDLAMANGRATADIKATVYSIAGRNSLEETGEESIALGDVLATGTFTIDATTPAEGVLDIYFMAEDEDGVEYEQVLNVEDEIAIVVQGYDNMNIADFTMSIASDPWDEGYGQHAYMCHADEQGNITATYGLNDFFTVPIGYTAPSIFLDVVRPFATGYYVAENNSRYYNLDGTAVNDSLLSMGYNQATIDQLGLGNRVDVLSYYPLSEADMSELPEWLTIYVEDVYEEDEEGDTEFSNHSIITLDVQAADAPRQADVVFSFPGAKYTLKVVQGEITPEEPVDVYILGEVNGNTWAPNVGVKMETEDHETYTATITTVGESGGGSYFSFTTKLAENASDWDGIAPYRFGAELNGEGDFWITPELVGTTLHLGEMGTQRAYRLEAGQWLFNLNLTDGTFVVTSLASGPDVDGNGIVDIADMNIVIDVILGLDQNPKADVDGNGIVDIADMNIVIDAILGN